MSNKNSRRARVIAIGACAVCAQTLFIREILGIITGTELVLGLALASWLFWIGAGGLLGGRFLRSGSAISERAFPGLSLSLALSVPLVVLLIRLGRSVLVDPPGSIPDIASAVGFILVATAPFGLLYGAVYNSASTVMKDPEERFSSGISSAYILEAAGSIAGGLLLTLLFFAFLTQLAASFAVSAMVTAVFLFTSARGRRAGWVVALSFAAAGFLAAPYLDRGSLSMVFRGYEVIEVVPSQYAELCVTKNRETVSVFSGGARLLSYPDPEGAAERVHIPLLAHGAPANLLMIGGGPGGGLDEALSHPGIERVEWIELDGRLAEAVDRADGSGRERTTTRELTGGKERTDEGKLTGGKERATAKGLTGDGRFMLRGSGQYDVIIVNVPDPVNLRWNRYFTAEFFESARHSLSSGGILTVRHGSSENFISARNAAVLGMINETLRSVFEYVDMVPGGTVFFIASDSPVDAGDIPLRLVERGLEGRLLVLDELPYRISKERREHLSSALAGAPRRINTDVHPVLVSHELVLNGWKSGTAAVRFLEAFLNLPPWALPTVILAAVILIGILARGGAAAKAAVFLTGLCSMTVQLSVMLAYQAFSGILYQTLVLLTAIFMAGAALGAYAAGRRRGNGVSRLTALHILMAVTAVLVPIWLWLQTGLVSGHLIGTAGFMALSGVGGLLTGVYYRTVVETAWPVEGEAPPALFYSWDMFGACAGGILAGTLLFPLSGLAWTAAATAAIHFTSALILTRKIVPGRA